MGKVQGVKEKLHYPIYDAFFVPDPEKVPNKTFKDFMTDPRMIRFFVDVQNKTRLETNLQASGVLPSLNTFEARAMRVVVSTLGLPRALINRDEIINKADQYFQYRTDACCQDKSATDCDRIKLRDAEDKLLSGIQTEFERACAAASLILSELIYNSVTTLLVGEKIMIEMPTYFFPSGAGVHPGDGTVSNHGEPDPMATFRFAEPVIIEPQQNFRVEMSFPQGVPGQDKNPAERLAGVKGPLRIWVVLDGYLTRDVQ
jgi:hypothetical protein